MKNDTHITCQLENFKIENELFKICVGKSVDAKVLESRSFETMIIKKTESYSFRPLVSRKFVSNSQVSKKLTQVSSWFFIIKGIDREDRLFLIVSNLQCQT